MRRGPDESLRIVIADDHAIFRDGFKILLDKIKELPLLCAGEASNGRELLQEVALKKPHLVITDIQMPLMDGIEATREIRKKYPKTEVIALSMFNEEHLVVEMLEAGASGYLLKNTSREELQKAIAVVLEGGVFFTPETATHLSSTIINKGAPVRTTPAVSFTEREREIILLVCKGKTNKEIAQLLHLSVRTIESHRESIYFKTDSRSAVELVIFALRNKVVSLEEL